MNPTDFRSYLNKLDSILMEVTMDKPGNIPGKVFMVSDGAAGKEMRDELLAQGVDLGTGKVTYLDINDVDISSAATYGKQGSKAYPFSTESGQTFICYKAKPPIVYLRGTDAELKLTSGGETAEGILGAAMYAKFINRETRERIGDVTEQDVYNVLADIDAAPGSSVEGKTISTSLEDIDNIATDRISFNLILKTAPYTDLMNPAMRPLLSPYIQSAIGYVNSNMAAAYSRYFYLNNKNDDISIVSAGPLDEKSSKADVKLVIKTQDGKSISTKLNTSLKIGGIEQFGQVYGTNAETIISLYRYLGIDISNSMPEFDEIKKNDTIEAIQFLYNSAKLEINKQLTKQVEGTEARFVDSLAQGIIHFATLGNPDVELVDFKDGKFKILRFDMLQDKLQDTQLVATCPPIKDKASGVKGVSQPVLYINDMNNPDISGRLIKVRCKIERTSVTSTYPDGYRVRHYVEKGKFLEKLTLVDDNDTLTITHDEIEQDIQQRVDNVVNHHASIRPPGTVTPKLGREKKPSAPRERR